MGTMGEREGGEDRGGDGRVVANESLEILIFQSSEFEDSHA